MYIDYDNLNIVSGEMLKWQPGPVIGEISPERQNLVTQSLDTSADHDKDKGKDKEALFNVAF